MNKCDWCGELFEVGLNDMARHCSPKCRTAASQNSGFSQIVGNMQLVAQQQRERAIQQQQQQLALEQNALVAEQNRQLSEIQAAQDAHINRIEAAAQRESELKQFLFDSNKKVKQFKASKDGVACLAFTSALLNQMTSAGYHIEELSQFEDKEYFTKVLRKVEALESKCTESDARAFDKFAKYYERHSREFQRTNSPKISRLESTRKNTAFEFSELPPEPRSPSEEELKEIAESVPKSPEFEELDAISIFFWQLVVWVGPLTCGWGWIAAGFYYWFKFKDVKERWSELNEVHQAIVEKEKDQLRKQIAVSNEERHASYLEAKSQFELKIPEKTKAAEAFNLRLDEKIKDEQKRWLGEKAESTKKINQFIKQHPLLEVYFSQMAEV